MKPRWDTVFFCAIVMALGWGLRGELGGFFGAMLPGTLLGAAIAVGDGRTGWLRRAPLLAMAGGLAFAIGGMMSYGRIIGYTFGLDMLNVTYGFVMVGVVGGLWGALGAGGLGLVLSHTRYRVWEVLVFAVAVSAAGRGLQLLLVDIIGLEMTPPRADLWPQVLAGCILLQIWSRLKRDPVPARLMMWGLVGGALGFLIGQAFQVYGSVLGPEYDWWKVKEQTFGLIMGGFIAYGAQRECETDADQPAPHFFVTALGILFALWFVPVSVWHTTVGHFHNIEVMEPFRAGLSHLTLMPGPDWFQEYFWLILRYPERLSDMFTDGRFGLRYIGLLALIAAAIWRFRRDPEPLPSVEWMAKGMLLWVMWAALLICAVNRSIPDWHFVGYWVHNGFLALAVLASAMVLFRLPEQTEDPIRIYTLKPAVGRFLGVFAVVFVILALIFAGTGIMSHGGEWHGGAQVRFGEPPPIAED